MRRAFQYMMLASAVVFLGLFLLLPVWTVVENGCRLDLAVEIFRNPIYVDGLLNSLCVALVTTFGVFCLSLILALVYDRFDFNGKELCNAMILVPMILPPFVGALGFQQLLGHYGILNTILENLGFARIDFLGGSGRFWSVCAIEMLHLYPIFYLNLITALGNIDPALDEAGANMGAGKLVRFFRIKLPLMRPGILAGGSLVLVWSFTELGTPLMFGYNRVTPVQILNGLNELESNPLPYTLVLIMMAVSALLYTAARVFFGGANASGSKGNLGGSARKLSGLPGAAAMGVFVIVTLLAALPHVILVLCAFSRKYYNSILPEQFTLEYFDSALSNPLVLPSIMNSLRYSLLAMVIALAAGILIALASRRWHLRGAAAADLLAMMPLAVPGVVIAFGFLSMQVKYRWAQACFNPVENPLWLLAIAYAIRRIPYVVRAVSSGLEQTPEELENAARNFGAGPFRVVAKITLPLVAANVMVGGLFAFSFSMLEVSDSLILAQKAQFFPITRALYELAQILGAGPGIACAFGVWAMLFMAGTLSAAAVLLGKKIGAVFRF